MTDFNDTKLLRDYHFLDSAMKSVESAGRRSEEAASNIPKARKEMLKQARQRGVQLELLPAGMQRERENTTRYEKHNRRMRWRVELLFAQVC